MKNFLISFIIPVYNVEKYLNKCVDSIINQTYKNIEIILVNDGSTDKSSEICEHYSQQDQRIKVINQRNKGQSCARNVGTEKASGEYLIFLDSDDYWMNNNCLQKIINLLNESVCDVLIINYQKFFENNQKYSRRMFQCNRDILYNHENQLQYLIDNKCFESGSWCKVVKKSIIDKYNLKFREGVSSEDIEWNLRLAIYAEVFDFLDEPVLAYVQREGSLTKSINKKHVIDLFNNIKYCSSILNDLEEKEKKKYNALRDYLSYQYATLLIYLGDINTLLTNEEVKEICEYKYLLIYGSDIRVNVIKFLSYLFGIKVISRLLFLYYKFNIKGAR